MRGVGDEIAFGVEQRAGKIEPLLDVDRVRGVLQAQAHLLGDRHVEVVEDLEHHRIDRRADRGRVAPRRDPFQHKMAEGRDRRPPLRLEHRRGVRLGDDRRPLDALAGRQILAPVQRRLVPAAAGKHPHGFSRSRFFLALLIGSFLAEWLTGRDRLDRDRLDDQPFSRHQKGELLAVGRLELLRHRGNAAEGDGQRRIGPRVFQMDLAYAAQAAFRQSLRDKLFLRLPRQLFSRFFHQRKTFLTKLGLDRLLAHRDLVGEAHAVRRQHARMRMDEHARHRQRVGDEAGMLAGRAAEAAQRVAGDVVAALDGDLLDRVRHVAHRDLDEAFGDFLYRPVVLDFFGQFLKFAFYRFKIQRLVA